MGMKFISAYPVLYILFAALSLGGNVTYAVDQEANYVLLCEENNYVDYKLTDYAPGSREWRELFELEKKRNENPKRPYFSLKYIGGKLSYGNSATDFLANDMPGQPNYLEWVGNIKVEDDAIYFELNSISKSLPRMRTKLKIDRYTGAYEELKFRPGGEYPDGKSTGICKSISKKQF